MNPSPDSIELKQNYEGVRGREGDQNFQMEKPEATPSVLQRIRNRAMNSVLIALALTLSACSPDDDQPLPQDNPAPTGETEIRLPKDVLATIIQGSDTTLRLPTFPKDPGQEIIPYCDGTHLFPDLLGVEDNSCEPCLISKE